jgi:outer membrane protein TolC
LGFTSGYNGVSALDAMSSGGGASLNVSAQISLTLPILGSGGFLNGRTMAQSEIGLDQAKLNYTVTVNADYIQILQNVQQALQAQATVKNNTEAFQMSTSVLEKLSADLLTGKVNRLEVRDAIAQARSFELQLEDSKVQHLQTKLNLAQLIGVDRLPGVSF